MTIRVSRKMDYANRFGIQQADQAIKRDIVRALVELITNSDDSYRRLEARQQQRTGQIIVEFQRRRVNTVLRVIDFAEGLDGATLDRVLQVYAEDTSGFSQGENVRGYFGRGLKDAILGLGSGTVTGIRNNRLNSAWLGIRDRTPWYEAQESRPVQASFFGDLGISGGSNATIVEITVSRDDIRIPQFENLSQQIPLHYALRNIASDPNRQLLLRDIDTRGNSRRELQVTYTFPVGQLLNQSSIKLPNSGQTLEVTLRRAAEPLNTPREGPYAQGGLLIQSSTAILDNTLLRFEADVHAQRFFGAVRCPHLDNLLRAGEPVLLATRDGLDRSHPFVRELFSVVESFLEPYIEEEARRARAEEHRVQDQRLRQKLTSALSQLNQIAKDELEAIEDRTEQDVSEPLVPPSGFGFVPEYTSIVMGKRKTLLLRGLASRVIPEGAEAVVTSENAQVTVLNPHVSMTSREDYPWIVEAKLTVEGRQVGAESILTAECEGLSALGYARVIVREDRDDPDGKKRHGAGLFGEIKFSGDINPRQRVRHDRETHDLIIYTRHASVSPYISDESGAGTDTPQGQVILAELVTEAVCGALARRGVETGRFPAPVGGEIEAIQVQQLRLLNQYAGKIHEAFVDSQFRNPH